jgi:MBG domain (YGX type)
VGRIPNAPHFCLAINQAIGIACRPTLTTTATASSLPGKYPIVITQGSLSAQNYFFEDSNGVLTVIP